MQKPEVIFYPMIDLLDVEKYLSDLHGKEIDLLIPLFGDDVSNDICKEWLVEPPETLCRENFHSDEEWEAYYSFEEYVWENFSDYEYVIVRICW